VTLTWFSEVTAKPLETDAAVVRGLRRDSAVLGKGPSLRVSAPHFLTRPALSGNGRRMWSDYLSVYQTDSARCDQFMFGWDRKLVCSMTMPG